MHQAALDYVATQIEHFDLDQPGVNVLDLGGRDVNGTTRHLFNQPGHYVVVDIAPHPSVDVVADASTLCLDELFDVVTSTECLEHTDKAASIVRSAFRHLIPGGVFLATMAGPGRGAHGASGEPFPPDGEFYCNVHPDALEKWLSAAGFGMWEIDVNGYDVRCTAWKSP